MAREKFILLWPCVGGTKRMTVKGKPGNTFAGDLATTAANLSSIFADSPGADGTAIKRINQIFETDGVTDASTTKPRKGEATVCTFQDENGDSHTYRFPKVADSVGYVDDGSGNEVLEQAAGDIVAGHLSSLTGFTLSFVSGYYDSAKQNA